MTSPATSCYKYLDKLCFSLPTIQYPSQPIFEWKYSTGFFLIATLNGIQPQDTAFSISNERVFRLCLLPLLTPSFAREGFGCGFEAVNGPPSAPQCVDYICDNHSLSPSMFDEQHGILKYLAIKYRPIEIHTSLRNSRM
jgi:hypothetical protein